MALFRAKDIVKQYSGHLALDRVSIEVPQGSIFALLGPNGAGKTTLLRIINQITAPDSGKLYFAEKKMRTKHLREIGYLPEERGLYKKMRVWEQAIYLAQLRGMERSVAEKKLRYWLERFDLSRWYNRKVEELSKGMQQKLQFVVTVMHEPRLLIFDEPFSGFDPVNTNLLKEEVLRLKNKGATIIFSTHNMGSVEELCDHIALINKSRIALSGSIDEVRKAYKPNLFEVRFAKGFRFLESTITSNYKVLEHKEEGTSHIFRFELLNNIPYNELLQQLMQYGQMLSFNEALPTMNDIFLEAVTDKKESKEEA